MLMKAAYPLSESYFKCYTNSALLIVGCGMALPEWSKR